MEMTIDYPTESSLFSNALRKILEICSGLQLATVVSRAVDLVPTRSASEAEERKFLAGASGWYEH